MNVAVSTSDLHAEGSLMKNTSSEMSPVARQATEANVGKLGGRKRDNSLESPLMAPQPTQQVDLFSGGLHSPRHGSVMGK